MPAHRTPQLLVASHHAAPAEQLAQVAERRGYAVRRAFTATQALALSHEAPAPADVIVLDDSLPDMYVLDASRALRDDPQVGPSTPLLLITTGQPTPKEHHMALRAGVWECLLHPFHAEEIGARLDTYVLLKLDGDRARSRPPRARSARASAPATTPWPTRATPRSSRRTCWRVLRARSAPRRGWGPRTGFRPFGVINVLTARDLGRSFSLVPLSPWGSWKKDETAHSGGAGRLDALRRGSDSL